MLFLSARHERRTWSMICPCLPPVATRLRRRRPGFSLVEALIALSIMALAGAVLLLSVESSLENTADAVDRTIADGIAQQMLDQILTKKYVENAGAGGALADVLAGVGAALDELTGGGTELYDDVDDYNGYTANPPEDIYGQPLGTGDNAGGQRLANFRVPGAFFQNWRMRVQVYFVDPNDHRIVSGSATAYRAVQVLVERLEADGSAIPLADRKRVITYIQPPAS